MGNEAKVRQKSEVAKLPLLAFAAMESPDRSGMLTPPFHTSVSVPFGWEEEPGKPRFCFKTPNTSSSHPDNTTAQTKCLQLPPRLLLVDPKIPKLLSPPITAQKGMFQVPKKCCGPFRFDRKQLGAMVLRKRGALMEKEWFCWLGKRCFGSKRGVGSASGSVFPSSEERISSKIKVAWTQKEGSFSTCEEKSSSRMKVAVTEKEGSFSTCLVQVKRKHRRRIETD